MDMAELKEKVFKVNLVEEEEDNMEVKKVFLAGNEEKYGLLEEIWRGLVCSMLTFLLY